MKRTILEYDSSTLNKNFVCACEMIMGGQATVCGVYKITVLH